MTESEIYKAFQDYVRTFPTAKDAAESLGYHESYVCKLLSGEKSITAGVAKKLGYDVEVNYKKKEE